MTIWLNEYMQIVSHFVKRFSWPINIYTLQLSQESEAFHLMPVASSHST